MNKISFSLFIMIGYLFLISIIQSQLLFPVQILAAVMTYAFVALIFILEFVSFSSRILTLFSQIIICAVGYSLLYQAFIPGGIVGSYLQFAIQLFLVLAGYFIIANLRTGIIQLETATNRLAFSVAPANCYNFDEAEPIISAEINRSRRYGNPLTFLYVIPIPRSITVKKHVRTSFFLRIVLDHNVDSKVLRIFYSTIRGTDYLVELKDEYIIMMVDTLRSSADILVNRLVREFSERINYDVYIGLAEFPHDGIIYEDLVGRARDNMVRYTEGIRESLPEPVPPEPPSAELPS